MKVETNDQVVQVGWRYPNPELEKRMRLHGLDPKLLKGMTQPAICLTLGLKPKDLPVPSVTECIILDSGRTPIVHVSVKRHYKDPHDKEKARKYSLAKALREKWPGIENKELRKKFWDVYNSRKKKKDPDQKSSMPEFVCH